ncbi:DNA-processing protein DprA [Maritimibacter sp. UBA3975]|uniref:DNA-processing protein DprA n=1 Tax=Maritimibacter sp. UBA3975 TaxID=1946833 RepID=UPI0025BD454C|nr:DNA-processing protein DprA [Maritimibacter sp. UBA3975]
MAWLRLLRSRRVGVTTFFRLMGEHGSAEAALEVLPDVAKAAGVTEYQVCPLPIVEKELDWAQKCGARMLCFGAPDYPAMLTDIPDPPPILWAIGDIGLLARPSVGLVGARNASSLGTRMARKLAADLGEAGMVVTSGLARGVDTAAHAAALATGTIAVMAGGVDVIYPSENAVLGEEIGRDGLRLSEAPMSLTPQARHFPRRNRIISGLSRAVVVVEAAAKSGSLITAEMALEQGREVFAVPGHPFDARASGCNRLIRDGATLLRGARDMLDALDAEAVAAPRAEPDIPAEVVCEPFVGAPPVDIPPAPPETRTLSETAALHQQILDRLGPSPVSEDQLVRDLALPTGTVASELTDLELEGQIQRAPGGMISRRA